MTRLRLIKNCNITCDSSGSNEPRWVMFPAILQLLPWSEMTIEICRLYKVEDGHNDENLFLRALAWASIILAGKRDGRSHSTRSFGENVVVAETRCQMLEVLWFCDREMAQPPSLTTTVLIFLVKNSTMKLSGVYILENTRQNIKLNLVPVLWYSRPCPRSWGAWPELPVRMCEPEKMSKISKNKYKARKWPQGSWKMAHITLLNKLLSNMQNAVLIPAAICRNSYLKLGWISTVA